MDTKKFQRATEIAKQIAYLEGLENDLKLVNIIDFNYRDNGTVGVIHLAECDSKELFDAIIDDMVARVNEKKNRLEKEFNEL